MDDKYDFFEVDHDREDENHLNGDENNDIDLGNENEQLEINPHQQLYKIEEEDLFSPHSSRQAQIIPPSSSYQLVHKFHYGNNSPSQPNEVIPRAESQNILDRKLSQDPGNDEKISIEVILTEEKLKELMKCKPTEEWISKTGKYLKHTFPELTKAHKNDLQQDRSNLRKTQAPPLEPLPITIQYNTICNWKTLQVDEKVQLIYMKLIKFILFRETSLQRMQHLLKSLEELYWKYASIIIDRLQFGRSIITDELANMIKIIHSKQQELSIAIAHHRTLSINVVESIVSWREMCARSTLVQGVPSIYYQQNNYLIKMMTDSVSLFRSQQTMKMWLGFEPNVFMIPPVPHDPKQIRLQLEEKRRHWLKLRQRWINNQLSHLQNLSHGGPAVGSYRRHTMTDTDPMHHQHNHNHNQGNIQRQGIQIYTSGGQSPDSHPSPLNDRHLRATQSSPIVIHKGVPETSESSTPKASPSPQIMLTVSRRMSQSISPMPSSDPSTARSSGPVLITQSRKISTSNSTTQLATAQQKIPSGPQLLPSLSTPNLSSTPSGNGSNSSRRNQPTVFFPESHVEGNEEDEDTKDSHDIDVKNDKDNKEEEEDHRREKESDDDGSESSEGSHPRQKKTSEDHEDGMKAAKKLSTSDSFLGHLKPLPSSPPHSPRESDDMSSTTSFGSSSATTQLEEEWLDLSHKCLPSWGTPTDPTGRIFWDDYDKNPHLVEAAIGFVDVFPEIFLVPPLSFKLSSRCQSCEQVLEQEILLQVERNERQEFALKCSQELNTDELQESHDHLFDLPLNIASEVELDEKEMNEYKRQLETQDQLKNRQQRNGMRDILSPGEIPIRGLSIPTMGMRPTSPSASPVISSHQFQHHSNQNYGAGVGHAAQTTDYETNKNSFTIFLTSSDHYQSPSSPHSKDPLIQPPIPYKINTKYLQQVIEKRLIQQTTRLMRIGNALVLIKDRSCAQKYISITPNLTNKKKITSLQATILVQSLIRGALTRWRLKRKRRALAKMQSLLLLQKYARRYIAKLRLRRKRREFRYECLILRKRINRRHKAAVIIQTFMKYSLFLIHREDYLRKYNSNKVQHTKYLKYLQAAVMIQKIFRGYKQRNDFIKWSHAIKVFANNSSHARQTIRNKLKYHAMAGSGAGGYPGGGAGGGGGGQRTLHYTVAGSGGFQFKFRKKEGMINSSLLHENETADAAAASGGSSSGGGLPSSSTEGKSEVHRERRASTSGSSSTNNEPKLMTLILTETNLFQTLLVGQNAGIEMIKTESSGGEHDEEGETGENKRRDGHRHSRGLLPQLSEDPKPSKDDDDFSLGTTPSSSARQEFETSPPPSFSFLETIPATPGTGTGMGTRGSTGAGTGGGQGGVNKPKSTLRRGLSRQNTFGASIISSKTLKKLASNGERSFILDDARPSSSSPSGSAALHEPPREEGKDHQSSRRRSEVGFDRRGGEPGVSLRRTNDAYVNPSVHKRVVFKKEKDPTQQTNKQNSDGLKSLLKNVFC